jgi:hypothetical protein
MVFDAVAPFFCSFMKSLILLVFAVRSVAQMAAHQLKRFVESGGPE